TKSEPDALLLATGSEVQLAIRAQKKLLEKENIDVRVVSMPAWDLFEAQDEAYKESVIPSNVRARVGIEMASPLGWDRYTGPTGEIIAIDQFGASAPGDKVIEEYGFTVDHVIEKTKRTMNRS